VRVSEAGCVFGAGGGVIPKIVRQTTTGTTDVMAVGVAD
jgi:hypothetical protein